LVSSEGYPVMFRSCNGGLILTPHRDEILYPLQSKNESLNLGLIFFPKSLVNDALFIDLFCLVA